MFHFKTRIASIVLAFGVFFTLSCSTINNSNSSDRPTQESVKQLQDRLSGVEAELSDQPRNSQLHLEKAEILFKIAEQTTPPANRLHYYKNMRDIAESGAIDQGDASTLHELISKAWSYEQGEAVKLLQREESEIQESNTERITSHFNNAITVNPDSLVTYNLLANTYYRTGNFNRAIQTLEEALGYDHSDRHDIREKLAYLYLESGNIENAIEHYRALSEDSPENSLLRHGLANAYMLNEQHEEAIRLLRDLIKDYPNRIEYKESLAGELYFTFREDLKQLIRNTEEVSSAEVNEFFEILNEIDSIFHDLDETVPLSDDIAYRKAAYLNNTSRLLKQLATYTNENTTALLEKRREAYLNRAMDLWERLSENNPDNINYVRNLYEIYVNLGMNEEADSLKRSYNL